MGNDTPYFEWWKTRIGQFRFRLRASNHEKIATGEAYVRKIDMISAMHLIDPQNVFPVRETKR
jgi:uncharacterized protein YegP (UPF0339 family)